MRLYLQKELEINRIRIEIKPACGKIKMGGAYPLYCETEEMVCMAVDNTQYKDRLFNFLFGSEENKAWTLSLYNAVNQSRML